jgi:hypothetical protein
MRGSTLRRVSGARRKLSSILGWRIRALGISRRRGKCVLSPYFPLAVLFVAALGFGLAPLGLAWAVGEAGFAGQAELPSRTRSTSADWSRAGTPGCSSARPTICTRSFFSFSTSRRSFLLPFAVAFTGLGSRGLPGDAGFCAAAGRGAGLGLGQGRFDLGVDFRDGSGFTGAADGG